MTSHVTIPTTSKRRTGRTRSWPASPTPNARTVSMRTTWATTSRRERKKYTTTNPRTARARSHTIDAMIPLTACPMLWPIDPKKPRSPERTFTRTGRSSSARSTSKSPETRLPASPARSETISPETLPPASITSPPTCRMSPLTFADEESVSVPSSTRTSPSTVPPRSRSPDRRARFPSTNWLAPTE